MANWLDTYDHKEVGQAATPLRPIAYSPGIEKMHVPITSQPLNAPIATAQGRDRNAAELISDSQAEPKGTAGQVWNALKGVGLDGDLLQWAFIQLYMESAGFSNGPASKDNNPGNIIWFKGQRRGVYMPGNKTYATHFNTLADFARVYNQLLNKAPGRPIAATSLADFAHRLKLNNYYGAESESSYLGKLEATAARLGRLYKFYKATDKKMTADAVKDDPYGYNPKKPKKPFKMPVWGWVLMGVGAFGLVKTALK